MITNIVPAVLQRGATLTTSAAPYVVAADASQVVIKRTVFSNVTSGAVTFTVYRVPSGSSADLTTEIIPPRSIAAHGTDLAPELSNAVLNPGDTIQALASAAASVNVFSSGVVAS